ncbi:hypothetical protein D3C86_911120 [compost metagenome]
MGHLDPVRVVEGRIRQALNRRGHGRREEHGVAGLGHALDQGQQLGLEALGEDLVGLVQHQGLNVLEVEGAALQEVHQAPGGADDHVGATLELIHLLVEALAAREGHDPALQAAEDAHELGADLLGELAGRRDDEHGGRLLVHRLTIEQGQAEGQGLARAGLGLDDEIAPLADLGDHERLDRRRVLEAPATQTGEQLLAELEGFKSGFDGHHGLYLRLALGGTSPFYAGSALLASVSGDV